MVDANILKKLPTRYDANKKFANRFNIYYYFSAKWKEDNTHEYYLFDGNISFENNFELMQDKFKHIEGYWSLYTDNKKYSISVPINKIYKWKCLLKTGKVPPLPFLECFVAHGAKI